MSIQDLGNIGEFIASIAVVASLLFLAIQVRTNNIMTRAATREELFKNDSNYLLAYLDPVTLSNAHLKMRKGEALTEIEEHQMLTHQQLNFRGMESYYIQYKLGFLDEVTWARRAKFIGVLFNFNPYIGKMWEVMKDSFDEDFEREVELILERTSRERST
jgi:hypothetical protein